MKSFIGHQRYLAEKTAKTAIQNKLVDAGMGKVTDSERVSNPKKLSSAAKIIGPPTGALIIFTLSPVPSRICLPAKK